MISADAALASAFFAFFLVFGKSMIQKAVFFLDENKKNLLLGIHNAQSRLSSAQESLHQARMHQKKVADQLSLLADAFLRDVESLSTKEAHKKEEEKQRYADLCARILGDVSECAKRQMMQEMIRAVRHFVVTHHVGKDVGVKHILATLKVDNG